MLQLCVLDLTTSTWMVDALDTASEIPLARIGATLCEVGHRAILFGGVSQAGAYLNDVYMLEWDSGKRRFHWTRTQTTGKGVRLFFFLLCFSDHWRHSLPRAPTTRASPRTTARSSSLAAATRPAASTAYTSSTPLHARGALPRAAAPPPSRVQCTPPALPPAATR